MELSIDWSVPRGLLNHTYIGLVGQADRIGVLSFVVFLEYNHFTPDTPMNRFYHVFAAAWEGFHWFIVIFPRRHLEKADALAKSLGLRRADGVPHVITAEGVKRFPLDQDNVFTLENIAGHFTYQNDFKLNKTAQQLEHEATDRVIAEHRARYLAGEFDHEPGTLPPQRL